MSTNGRRWPTMDKSHVPLDTLAPQFGASDGYPTARMTPLLAVDRMIHCAPAVFSRLLSPTRAHRECP